MAIYRGKLIKGDNAIDDRGKLSFINDFNPAELGIKRFYTVENHNEKSIRGWHGHKREEKYAYVPEGWAKFTLIDMKTEDHFSFVLHEDKPMVLHIPAGYYNGFETQTRNTRVIFFSTLAVEDSTGDDFRKEFEYNDRLFFAEKIR